MTYVRPQVLVHQEFQQLNAAVVQRQNAFILGPNYQLFRYSEAAEKALIALGAYDKDTDQNYDYPNQPVGSLADQTYAKLILDEAVARYLQISAGTSNPLNVVSDAARNKVRAVPRIDVTNRGGAGTVDLSIGGCHVGTVALPEAYYFYPQVSFDLGTDDGIFDYQTTEGVDGEFDVPSDATTAGVVVAGPTGLACDFDTAAAVKSPLVITFAGLSSSFTLKQQADRVTSHIDDAVDSSLDINVTVNLGAAGLNVTYTAGTRSLLIEDDGSSTVAALRAAIVAAAGVVTEFDVSEVTGTGTDTIATAVDQDAVNVNTSSAIEFMPDVWRTFLYENDYVFATGNGYNRSPALLRDVQVGDKVLWSVTPVSTGVPETGWANVIGLEADYTRATNTQPAASSGNQSTVSGDDLSSGVAGLYTPGSDNQRDFDGVNTKIFSLDAALDYMIGNLGASIFTDSLVITVTTGGVKGVARATVENSSGTYRRTNVLIEDQGSDDGQVYLGSNVYINLDQGVGDPDATFQVADVYTVGPLQAPFNAVSNFSVTGDYTGSVDTNYQIKVMRGGLFDRDVVAIDGLQIPVVSTTLVPDISDWAAGDVDDEYILECTTGGTITAARFQLKSQRGDNASNLSFPGYGSANVRAVGTSGLKLYFTTAGTPSFTVGDYWVVNVKASRPLIRVTDTAGVDQEISSVVTDGDNVNLGLFGLTISIPNNTNNYGFAATGGLAYNDTFVVEAVASKAAQIQTLVLDEELPSDVETGADASGAAPFAPDLIGADLHLVRNGLEIPKENRDPAAVPGSYNWIPNVSDVDVMAGITIQDSEWVDLSGNKPFIPLISGTQYLQYRALMRSYSNDIYAITDPNEVVPMLGPVDPDNPLAAALYFAALNCDGVEVRFTAVTTNDAAGYGEVLDLIERTNTVYGITPLSQDDTILALVDAHVDAMSNEYKKRWRIGIVSSETPTEEAKVDKTTNPGDVDWLATITQDPSTVTTKYTRVEFTTDPDLLGNAKIGDELRYNFNTDAWGNVQYSVGVIASIESTKVCYLTESISAPVTLAERAEVWHALTAGQQASAVAATAASYADRRIIYVFPNSFQDGSGVTYDATMLAACVAGLRSSVVPQQGLTNTEIVGVESVPLTYSYYTPAQLDEIAENGGFIIMQELRNGIVFVRHQLTTARAVTTDWKQTEMSVTTNYDSIAYFFADMLEPYIGRYNVTAELIEVLRTQMEAGLRYLGSFTSVGLLGPQIDLSSSEIVSIQQDETQADRVRIHVRVALPAPLNNIDLYLVA